MPKPIDSVCISVINRPDPQRAFRNPKHFFQMPQLDLVLIDFFLIT